MLGGFIKLHRSIMEWGWYADSDTKALFIHLLLNANFKPAEWKGVKLNAGQLITSQEHLAKDLNMTRQHVRTILNRLVKSGNITIKSTNKYSLITIVNWLVYQAISEED